jgi:hypothetical protein
MPPTFLYLLAVVTWAAFACVVWIVAAVMLITPRTKRFAKPLCWAMAGTFPFVLAYQFLAVPIVAVVLLSGWTFWKLLEPGSPSLTTNPVVIVASISVAFIAVATILTMSLAGFYDGWKTGWKCGQGENLRDALSKAPAYNQLREYVHVLYSRRSSAKS